MFKEESIHKMLQKNPNKFFGTASMLFEGAYPSDRTTSLFWHYATSLLLPFIIVISTVLSKSKLLIDFVFNFLN